ncbi:unnamed protein product [Somion occarium]|uniref:RRM domain-containing protein n=1 Tax=Somion occarium TaxID=3059160 RepID=A0ABP1D3G6_9APHY
MSDNSSAPASTSSSLLSYPAPSSDEPALPTAQPRSLLKDRLYVGNLHPSVDEYTLLQSFSKGYAFVQFTNSDDAAKALVSANDKLLRGRKIVVTYAHQAPTEEFNMSGASRPRRIVSDVGRPTTLSLLKSASGGRSATEDKIAKMEAKLRQLEQSKPDVPLHPSLPPKPIGVTTSSSSTSTPRAATRGAERQSVRSTASLPSLPIVNPLPTKPASPGLRVAPSTTTGTSSAPRRSTPTLSGVKIVKPKNR